MRGYRIKTIEGLCSFLKIDVKKFIKSPIYRAVNASGAAGVRRVV
jgi:hypothetical protein